VTPATFDPGDVVAIHDGLIQILSPMLGTISVAEGPVRFTSGLDTFVYAVKLDGSLPPEWAVPLVLRIYPSVEQRMKAEHEFAIQRFVTARGFPAPEPLHVNVSGEPWGLPFMIMQRATGSSAMDRFKNPLAIAGIVKAMATLQARLHVMPTDGCPLPYDSPLVERRLDPSRRLISQYQPAGLDAPLRWLEDNIHLVRNEEPVLTHNDYHPFNLIVDGDRMTLLDWSDAALGDRHCDVARTLALFWLAPSFERSFLSRTVLRTLRGFIVKRYESAYASHLPLDPERLRYWQALHAFKAWLQIATMRQEGEAAIGARGGVLAEIPPGLVASLRRYLEQRTV
jgi:aminoglycoside phosphotransferase (APT) family kinase protein